MGTLTKLSELAIGDNKRAQRSQTLQSLIAVLLRSLLVNGSIGKSSISTIDLLRLPNEVLKEITLVLGQEKVFSLFNDITEICHKVLTFGRKFLGRAGECSGFQEAIKSYVNLLVLQKRLALETEVRGVIIYGRNFACLERWKRLLAVQGGGFDATHQRRFRRIGVCD
jgi:hypothetical protein